MLPGLCLLRDTPASSSLSFCLLPAFSMASEKVAFPRVGEVGFGDDTRPGAAQRRIGSRQIDTVGRIGITRAT